MQVYTVDVKLRPWTSSIS